MTYKRVFFTLCGVNFFVYGLNAVYNCFMPLYLGNYFDEIAVGTLLSIGPIIMILAPILWGKVSDKAKSKNFVLILLIICASISFLLIVFNNNFIYVALMLAVFMFFSSPYGGLVDTITIEATQISSLKYGPIRLMGTIGYGLIAVIISLLPVSGNNTLFIAYAVIGLIAVLMLAFAPKVEGHASKREKVSIMPLIRDKNMTLILIITFVVMFSFSYYLNFTPTYITETLGLPSWVWGINIFATLAIEFPFFIMFDKIMKHWGLRSMLIVTVIISAARYLVLGIVTSPFLIILISVLTGSWITVATYCGTYYISTNLPENIQASGQSYMYAVAWGIPKVLAGIGGGIITKYLSVPVSYVLCGVACLICIFAALDFPKSLNGNGINDKK